MICTLLVSAITTMGVGVLSKMASLLTRHWLEVTLEEEPLLASGDYYAGLFTACARDGGCFTYSDNNTVTVSDRVRVMQAFSAIAAIFYILGFFAMLHVVLVYKHIPIKIPKRFCYAFCLLGGLFTLACDALFSYAKETSSTLATKRLPSGTSLELPGGVRFKSSGYGISFHMSWASAGAVLTAVCLMRIALSRCASLLELVMEQQLQNTNSVRLPNLPPGMTTDNINAVVSPLFKSVRIPSSAELQQLKENVIKDAATTAKETKQQASDSAPTLLRASLRSIGKQAVNARAKMFASKK